MKKTYAIVNFLSVLLVLLINGLSQAQRWNDTTIGELSGKYENLFTPASYAFAIWGLIFLMLIGYSLFQIKRAFFSQKETPSITQTGWWFAIANVLNAAWVVAFTYEYILLSVLIMLGILGSLLQIIRKTNMERWDAPIEVIAYLVSEGLSGNELTQIIWTMVMIAIAVVIHILMVWLRNMREFAAVAIWAFIAIYIRHKDGLESVAYFALAGAIVLVVVTAIHAFKNRKYLPHLKLKERFS